MKTIFDKKNFIPVVIVFLFFSAFIILGASVYKDYGISTDDPADYLRGKINYERLMGGSSLAFNKACAQYDAICYYPPIFDMVLYAFAPTGDTQSIYLHRHQIIFAFFAFSVFVFFLIGKKIFKDWKIGLLGAFFLILSPRIFANSFYNPKDLPFLSAYIIAIYTMLLFLEKKNILSAILHGIATAIVCNVRIPGMIIIPITALFYLFDLVLAKEPLNWKNLKESKYLKAIILGAAYLIVTVGLIYLTFPKLYTHPISNYIQAFTIFKHYPWKGYQLYMGQNISNHIPWHYSMVWFSISSPILYVALFIFGLATLIYKTVKTRIRAHFQAMRDFYLVGACGILPIIVVIVLKSVIYSNNRQMYFCYPALLLVSLYGFTVLIEKLKQITIRWQMWAGVVLVLGLAYPVYFMVRYHPYQYVYFNFLAGANMTEVKGNYTLDAWGMTIKQGLEFIAQTDASAKIRVEIDGATDNYLVMPKEARDRINLTTVSPKYIIWCYRYHPLYKVIPGKVVYSVKVGNTDIMTVYKQER